MYRILTFFPPLIRVQTTLEREGFEVISTRGGELPVVRIDDKLTPSWWVHTPTAVHQCDSINDLINTLRDYRQVSE